MHITTGSQFPEPNWIHEPSDIRKKVKEEWEHRYKQKTPPAPKPSIETLFPNLDRWSIGFDPVFSTLKALAAEKAPSYPPYNIKKYKDGNFLIEMALAGFSREEIEITVEDRTLVVKGSIDASTLGNDKGEVIYKGIAKRDFTSTFAMADHVEVDWAAMDDGLLTIALKQELPEALKPKKIDIK